MNIRPEIMDHLLSILDIVTESELNQCCNYLDKKLMNKHEYNKMIKNFKGRNIK